MTTNQTWMTDYPEEVLAWMRQREAKHLNYNGNSPQLSSRGELVDLICMVTEHLKLSVATTHLAVHLLDRFMDSHFIMENHLKLTALTVIMLAAKFEEKDVNVPGYPALNALVENQYTVCFFNMMEKFILNFFNWNIGTVTVAHFAEFYLAKGVSATDTVDGASITCLDIAWQTLWKSTSYFVDLSLHDRAFMQWPTSLVAAACVACGRLSSNFEPIWSATLETTTGYTIQSLSQIMDLFLRLYRSEKKSSTCSTPESGYGSRCPSLQGSP
uniref:Cyclin N-terminal domain-containing protein n=1 Tax=Scylla olivacea TaxID=85551 RepID=A0A0P4WN69_SCYOL